MIRTRGARIPAWWEARERPRCGERTRIWIALEERGRDEVHARVSRLRRQNRRDQQLEGVRVVELSVGPRVLRLELVQNGARFVRRFHSTTDS